MKKTDLFSTFEVNSNEGLSQIHGLMSNLYTFFFFRFFFNVFYPWNASTLPFNFTAFRATRPLVRAAASQDMLQMWTADDVKRLQ